MVERYKGGYQDLRRSSSRVKTSTGDMFHGKAKRETNKATARRRTAGCNRTDVTVIVRDFKKCGISRTDSRRP